jgi:alpha-D-ribose 1-methylphosphonate 5-triphosphate synthase subunit PhnG
MTRAEWVSILARARAETVRRLAALVEEEVAIEVTRPPSAGLLLATVREAVEGATFHPGEILVTTCEVRAGACLGTGIVLGDDEEGARAVAVVDAALQQAFARRDVVLWSLAEECRWRQGAERAEEEMVRSTMVHFDTMEPQR